MKADRIDLGLTGYDELFMSTEERLDAKKPKVDELPLNELKPFKDHPFKVMEDEEMERLKESIRESGVLIPALARPTESGYELISGPRRLAACRALGNCPHPDRRRSHHHDGGQQPAKGAYPAERKGVCVQDEI